MDSGSSLARQLSWHSKFLVRKRPCLKGIRQSNKGRHPISSSDPWKWVDPHLRMHQTYGEAGVHSIPHSSKDETSPQIIIQNLTTPAFVTLFFIYLFLCRHSACLCTRYLHCPQGQKNALDSLDESYRWLWVTTRIKSRSSRRVVSVLNCWAISQASL